MTIRRRRGVEELDYLDRSVEQRRYLESDRDKKRVRKLFQSMFVLDRDSNFVALQYSKSMTERMMRSSSIVTVLVGKQRIGSYH